MNGAEKKLFPVALEHKMTAVLAHQQFIKIYF